MTEKKKTAISAVILILIYDLISQNNILFSTMQFVAQFVSMLDPP